MILNLYLLIGITLFINYVVASQLKVDSEIILCIIKMLKSENLNDIGIVYSSKQLNGYADNEWWISNILKDSYSFGIPVQVTRFGKISRSYSTTQIILFDSFYPDEMVVMLEQFGKDVSMLILLTRNDSDYIFDQLRSYESQLIIGRYSNERANFSRLSQDSQENVSIAVASWTADKGFQGTLFHKDCIFPTGASGPLSVIIFNDPPFTTVKSHLNGSEYAEGYLIDLWNLVTEQLNLSYEINFLHVEESSIDTIGEGYSIEVDKYEPDVILYPSARWFEYRKSFTGIYTGISLELCAYQRKKHMSYLDFLQTINLTCFGAMSVAAIISLLLLYFGGNDLVESIFSILVICFNQSQMSFPRSYSGRFAIISFSIAVMIFSLICTGTLTSLAVTGKDMKPKSVKELMNPKYHSTLVPNTSTDVIMLFSSLKPLIEKIILSESELAASIPLALSGVLDNDLTAFIERERSNPYFRYYKSYILEVPIDIPKQRTYFFIRRDLTLKKTIDHKIKRLMENGILTQLRKKWWTEMDMEYETISVTIDDVAVIFAPLLLGLFLTLLTFCVERRSIIA